MITMEGTDGTTTNGGGDGGGTKDNYSSNNDNINNDNNNNITLDSLFLYCHNVTNEISKHPLSIKQLCRFLAATTTTSTNSTSTSTNTTAATVTKHITLDTNVIQLITNTVVATTTTDKDDDHDHDTTTTAAIATSTSTSTTIYSPVGWISLRNVPIIREALVYQWYYYDYDYTHTDNNNNEDDDLKEEESHDTVTTTTNTKSVIVQGPVSCCILSNLFYFHSSSNSSSSNINDSNENQQLQHQKSNHIHHRMITLDTLVCPYIVPMTPSSSLEEQQQKQQSSSCSTCWQTIRSLPFLQYAMEALYDHRQQLQHQESSSHHTTNPTSDTSAAAIPAVTSATLIQDELHSFLAGMDDEQDTPNNNNNKKKSKKKRKNVEDDDHDDPIIMEEEEESYESDGGTIYVRSMDGTTWVREDIYQEQLHKQLQQQQQNTEHDDPLDDTKKNKKCKKTTTNTISSSSSTMNQKKKNHTTKFSNRFARNWIYIDFLPMDCTKKELQELFSKAGIFDLDPRTLLPKIKLYDGKIKKIIKKIPETTIHQQQQQGMNSGIGTVDDGNDTMEEEEIWVRDASICYAHKESVDLAIRLFDETPLRLDEYYNTNNNNNNTIGIDSKKSTKLVMKVERAKFTAKPTQQDQVSSSSTDGCDPLDHDDNKKNSNSHHHNNNNKRFISNAQRKIAKLAAIQATAWDEGEYNGRITGGRKGLRIIVLKHLFSPSPPIPTPKKEHVVVVVDSSSNSHIGDDDNDNKDNDSEEYYFNELERMIRNICEKYGIVEKITIFTKNPLGVVIVKYKQPGSANDAIKELNGQFWENIVKSSRSSSSSSSNTMNDNNASNDRQDSLLPPVEASFWDGITDYTTKQNELIEKMELEKRELEFGNWLESQSHQLPDELKLQME